MDMGLPFQNGFLVFTLGVLFILSVYHLLLYFQNKQQIYLLYSSYTFFIMLSQAHRLETGFIKDITSQLGNVIYYAELYTETYYILYFFFAFQFLEVSKDFPKWTKACTRAIYVLIGICALKFCLYLISGDYSIVSKGYYVFVVYMLFISIIAYYLFFRVKNPLKYYIIIGSLILLVTSYSSLFYYEHLHAIGESDEPAYTILYAGFIMENLVFSLGLGRKQKLILDERNQSRYELMDQLEENERLRKKIQLKYESEMQTLSETAEADKMEALRARYDKELSDLKMATLRSQMNPHFIFNSLNSIKRYIIDQDRDQAVYYLNKFSKLIRLILNASTKKVVSLEEELETISLYLEIENIRFRNELNFEIVIPDSIRPSQFSIPSLLLQPFLENAIWHGLSLKEGLKQLVLRIYEEEGNYLVIEVEDNGIGRKRAMELKAKKAMQRESHGLRLTSERLARFSNTFKNEHDIAFIDLQGADGSPAGTLARIKLPIK